MTRIAIDSLYPLVIPDNVAATAQIILGYVGHDENPQSYAQAVERFGGTHLVVSIAAHNAVDAQVLDIEHGAVDPADKATIQSWLARQRARGQYPSLYVNTSTYPQIHGYGLGLWNWWAANWVNGPHIPPMSSGVQYGGGPGYDISIVNDYIEGWDMDEATFIAYMNAWATQYGGTYNGSPTGVNFFQWVGDLRGLLTSAINNDILPAIAAIAPTLTAAQIAAIEAAVSAGIKFPNYTPIASS